ncbi:hypothetical protein HMI54_002397 [Coelomomyces lativittatus]|nr:hypothetical protein HMI54_002397 [Coelomomyces lativittatus]
MYLEGLVPFWQPLFRSLKNNESMKYKSRLKLEKSETRLLTYYQHKAPLTLIQELFHFDSDQLVLLLGKSVSLYKHFLIHFARAYISQQSSTLLRTYVELNKQVLVFQSWKMPASLPILQEFLIGLNTKFLPLIQCFEGYEDPLITWGFVVLQQIYVRKLRDQNKYSPNEIEWLIFLTEPGKAIPFISSKNFDLLIELFEKHKCRFNLSRLLVD